MTLLQDPMPPIGTLTERVALLRRIAMPDAPPIYVPIATVWACVRKPSEADNTHTVVLRFRADLTAGDRITYRGRHFEVQSTGDLNGRRAYLMCILKESGNG